MSKSANYPDQSTQKSTSLGTWTKKSEATDRHENICLKPKPHPALSSIMNSAHTPSSADNEADKPANKEGVNQDLPRDHFQYMKIIHRFSEANKSKTPLAATYLLGSMLLFSETRYCAWINGVELELWDYFSQNTDPALLDPMWREEYEAIRVSAHQADGWWTKEDEIFRFYPRQEWLGRVEGCWPDEDIEPS